MSKAVMISIRPEWCELIINGKKTIEVRKTKPKLATPFKCYIYESGGDQRVGNENFNCYLKGKGRKKIIGEFICDSIRSEYEVADGLVDVVLEMQSCVDCSALIEYSGG
ncbi:MAG: ASCH domain-containing protein, partial [Oscillospiraceae bacterium]|nr:ASCH domain-containing protein [Oscillospiraceae bacterium]